MHNKSNQQRHYVAGRVNTRRCLRRYEEKVIIRPANVEDMDDIYLMGIDVWGEGQPEKQYLAGCRGSEKYMLGEWYCLTDGDVVVSSLITYKNCFGLADRYGGIGSIATHPNYRKNGYAAALIQNCIDKYTKDKYLGILLYSDVEPAYYEKFGFAVVERNEESALMYLSLNGGVLPELPDYF